MKKIPLTLALLASALPLGGCGWLFGDEGVFRDRGDNYRAARLEKPLAIPPGLSTTAIDDELAIPATSGRGSLEGEFVVPRPEPLEGNPDAELVKIQKLDTTSWILVEVPPGEVWPRVRQFLTSNQLSTARADAAAGVIETGWLQPKAEGSARERYRFRIEQGVQRGSSEVYVVQDARGNGESWPQSSTDPAREGEMIRALAQFVADSGSAGAVSMLAQRAIDSKGKVFLDRGAGSPYLRLELPFSRAWASLAAALPKAGFTVDDLNRSEREFWVRFEPPKEEEESRGFWGTLWDWTFGGDEEDDEELFGGPEVVYTLRVRPLGTDDRTVTIGVERQDGQALAKGVAEQLLNRIKGNLS